MKSRVFITSRVFSAVLITACLGMASATYAELTNQPSQSNLASLFGQNQKSKFLPVNQAFNVSATQDGDKLLVAFKVTSGHYVYQDKLSLKLPDGVSASAWQFDKMPSTINDPTFGQVAVFEEDVVASTTLSTTQAVNGATVGIKWQGCAKAGLCYPPETLSSTITLSKPAKSAVKPSVAVTQPTQTTDKTDQKDTALNGVSSVPAPISPAPSVATATDVDATPSDVNIKTQATVPSSDMGAQSPSAVAQDLSALTNDETAQMDVGTGVENGLMDTGVFAQNPTAQTAPAPQDATTQTAPTAAISHSTDGQTDPFGINERPLVAAGVLFLLGLLLALTPCVYPMIPIVANIVARSHTSHASTRQGLLLSGAYGVGVACAYGILGMIIAWFGQALGILGHLQNPYVLGGFALLFLVLALAMFDVIQLKMPSGINQFLQKKSQSADKYLGSIGGSFLAGLLSALVVSPCVSLPMAGALSAVATTQNVGLGFIMLFMLGLGLSVPLVIMGTMQAKFMPKSGAWTLYVKEFCALLLLAVAVSLTERIWVSPWVLALWAVWFALVSVWLYRVGALFAKAVAMVAGIWAACLMIGASMGSTNPWQPISGGISTQSTQSHNDLTITTLAELDEILVKHEKVLVDITATWCVECRIMEQTLFKDRPDELSAYQVVKLDITNTTDDSQAVLARYGLFGPPALLIYHQGQLKNVLLGETKRADFVQALSL